MNTKDKFIEALKHRTKKFAVDVILFCETLKNTKASSVIAYQLIKSATSTGANYRAACRGRSKSEFYSKMCIVVEESDESAYWLEVINDAQLSENQHELDRLLNEAIEISKIMTKAKDTTYKNING
ncbi:four helix bundle protein [uncultured Draconibacterium sp.]|uniref:four helix bundle protein n=1 Tax=uncultured Draconibacterium sp. TaxID=1573823 RepID=UPI0025D6BD7B|nr:four helix bundle protein [uncultured Draconibacterium sp.]